MVKLDPDQENILAEAYSAGKENLAAEGLRTLVAFDAMVGEAAAFVVSPRKTPAVIAKVTAMLLAYALMAMTPEAWVELGLATKKMRAKADSRSKPEVTP